MRIKQYRTIAAAALGALAMASPAMAFDSDWDGSYGRGADGDGMRDGGDRLSLQEKIELLRQKVKYVFVIFHENSPLTIILAPTRAQTAYSRPRKALFRPTRRRAFTSAISTRLSTSNPSRRS